MHIDRASPGLAKVRAAPLVQRRRVELCTAQSGRWREILEDADVVSEGAVRAEDGVLIYYGTTSVLLLRSSSGGALPDLDVASLAAIVRLDPHVRLRALRIAHREASARAGSPIGVLRADIAVGAVARGVVISVEVTARLPHRTRTPLAGGSGPRTISGAR